MGYIERKKKGDEAAARGADVFNKKYLDRQLYLQPKQSLDYNGSDYILIFNGKEYNVDFKNNHDSYIFQYNPKSCWTSAPNPYRNNCITDYIFVYHKDTPKIVFEYDMPAYYNRFFKDDKCAARAKILSNENNGYMSYEEYKIHADILEIKLRELIKPNIEIYNIKQNDKYVIKLTKKRK